MKGEERQELMKRLGISLASVLVLVGVVAVGALASSSSGGDTDDTASTLADEIEEEILERLAEAGISVDPPGVAQVDSALANLSSDGCEGSSSSSVNTVVIEQSNSGSGSEQTVTSSSSVKSSCGEASAETSVSVSGGKGSVTATARVNGCSVTSTGTIKAEARVTGCTKSATQNNANAKATVEVIQKSKLSAPLKAKKAKRYVHRVLRAEREIARVISLRCNRRTQQKFVCNILWRALDGRHSGRLAVWRVKIDGKVVWQYKGKLGV